MRLLVRIDAQQAVVVDANLFSEQHDLLVQSVVLRFQSDAGIATTGCPTAGVDGGVLGQPLKYSLLIPL